MNTFASLFYAALCFGGAAGILVTHTPRSDPARGTVDVWDLVAGVAAGVFALAGCVHLYRAARGSRPGG